MAFSTEWDDLYREGRHNSVWPWSDLVSLVSHFGDINKSKRVLELGCGAGANIPFFISSGMDYYGIEGSEYETGLLLKKYNNNNRIHIKCADFTKEIPFDGVFDIVIDRGSLTTNTTEDISNCIEMCKQHMKKDGLFIGIDWMSTEYGVYNSNKDFTAVDTNTRIYHSGHFQGMGNIHFSTPEEIQILFKEMDIIYMHMKKYEYIIPIDEGINNSCQISFVAKYVLK